MKKKEIIYSLIKLLIYILVIYWNTENILLNMLIILPFAIFSITFIFKKNIIPIMLNKLLIILINLYLIIYYLFSIKRLFPKIVELEGMALAIDSFCILIFVIFIFLDIFLLKLKTTDKKN